MVLVLLGSEENPWDPNSGQSTAWLVLASLRRTEATDLEVLGEK